MQRIAILLAEGFEELEAITLIDILRRAKGTEVYTLALTDNLNVSGAHQITVLAEKKLSDLSDQNWDLVVLPGGLKGAETLRDDPRVTSLLEAQLGRNKKVAAICAGPIALGAHGMLKGRRATVYPGFEKEMLGAILSNESVVVDEDLTTAKGPGFAAALALSLVEQLLGKSEALRVRAGLLL